MIEVDRLSKSYGSAHALRGITFAVQRGEVVGFLGPNGAGKSTTMKILTGFLLPSSGGARVAGLDVVEDSLEVRRRIGYLPESTPLYTEMRVDEYLRFAAEIRGVARPRVRGAVDRVVSLCGLERVVGKDILELSKGYRQRVGLAQAMVHEPDLLILDEPTSGLDPNQIVEVRDLIQRLGAEHTVILSTHYLQEVEAACSRVIVIDRGVIVGDGTQEELVASLPGEAFVARFRGAIDTVRAVVDGADLDLSCTCASVAPGLVELRLDVGAGDPGPRIARLAATAGLELLEMRWERPSLEDAFRSLTLGSREEVRDRA
ncbi:MAG: ATP-binding cassette domain-containing protein [Planctomycetota bacterium]